MPARHVVVDGSNIATEGRSLPSLVQLDVAVREYRREFPEDVITVVVDATFGHRIDSSERADFDEAVAHNEIVSPPAGAIGRGDAFLLRVAEKVGATVLSNDSFQEFHGEHEWLFDNGRLIGGKPVPGVGWIFTPRTPVRGPKSRDSMREARRAKPGPNEEIKKVQKAIAVATEEAVDPDSPKVKRRRRGRGGAPPAEPVNDPLPFIEFVAAHPLGSPVDAEVESFSSHGAFVAADGLRCYIPLTGLGDPAPRAAKDILKRGETRQFVLQALDPPRRGIELALAEFAHVSGVPTAETVEEEIKESARRPSRRKRGGRGRSSGHDADVAADEADPAAGDEGVAVVPTDVVVLAGAKAKDTPKAKATRSRKAVPEAAPEEPAQPTPAEPAPASGPRKRPARPRAGVPRLEPAQAPAPLAPTPATRTELPTAVPAPPTRKRAPRKAAAPLAAAPVPAAERLARPSRRRAAAASPAPEPAATDTPPTPARRAGRRAAATGEPAGAAPATVAAPRAAAKKVAVAKAPGKRSAAGLGPAASAVAPVLGTEQAPKKAAAKKAAAKTAAAKRVPPKG